MDIFAILPFFMIKEMASVQFLLLVCQLFLSYFIKFIMEDLTAIVQKDLIC